VTGGLPLMCLSDVIGPRSPNPCVLLVHINIENVWSSNHAVATDQPNWTEVLSGNSIVHRWKFFPTTL
jgi:hypothetical protein